MDLEAKQSFSKPSTWYKKRTNLERLLIIASLVIIFFAIALVVSITIITYKIRNKPEVCSTSECIHAASTVLKFIDQSVNPCDDFYEFACGSYLKNTNIAEDKSSISSFVTLSELVENQVKRIISEPLKPDARKPHKLLKRYYDICMNTTAIEANGVKTVKEILKELGGWPLLESHNWNEHQFDWKRTMYKLRNYGFGTGYFVSVYICSDAKNSTRRVVKTGQAGLGLGREFLVKGFNEKLVQDYYDYKVDISVLFGATRSAALKEIKEVVEFEIKLANITLPKEKSRNSTLFYNPMTVAELQFKHPFIPWVEYINSVLRLPDVVINEDETIIVTVPQYLSDVNDLLNETPKRIQANHILSRVAMGQLFTLPEVFRNRQFQFLKALTGQAVRSPRWKECSSMASGSVHLAVAAEYVRKHFKKEAKAHADEMVDDIRAEFVKILKTIDWMDEATRKNALEKANSMTALIGYPEELLDDNKIEEFYLDLEITTDNYLKSAISRYLFSRDYYGRKFRKPIIKGEWIDHSYPETVNAYYFSSENSIEIPAGILQGVFFGADRPRYMNYGSIGYVIGHEITHGFDDRGRQYDKEGNLNNWWGEDTTNTFKKKAQCIIDQYGNYTVPEINLNLNGINNQAENIADNGGIKEAYLAYQEWVRRNGLEPRLPGLDYTPNQMFWISAANSRCSKQRNELYKLSVTAGYHSPSRFRVLGPFSNSEYFAKDFNCPSGSAMNPVHKCHVW